MISFLGVQGFKSLQKVDIKLGRLTLLVGENGAGKSSLIQLLLLLRQSASSGDQIEGLELSGDLFEAGTAQDVLHPAADYRVKLDWKEGNDRTVAEFIAPRTAEAGLSARRLILENPVNAPKALLGDGFTYLNAERIGPRLWSKTSPSQSSAGPLGKFGEFTAAYFAKCFDQQLRAEGWAAQLSRLEVSGLLELTPDEISETGGLQHRLANLLLSRIVPGVAVGSRELLDLDGATIRFIRDPNDTKVETRPTHVGFGYSVALPVLLGAFTSTAATYVVENPEAHLHPRSQSLMGIFLGVAANLTDQLIVESHSDHVLNGIRLAVSRGVLSHDDVRIIFFRQDASRSVVFPIDIDSTGKLKSWPERFFDQIETDLARL